MSRVLCAEAGVGHPATLAIILPSEEKLLRYSLQSYPSIRVVSLKSYDTKASEMEEIVRDFIESDLMRDKHKVRA